MTALTVAGLVRRFWPAIPIVVLAGLALIFRAQRDDVRQTLTNERSAWTASVERADRVRAEQERGFARQIATAATTFADRLAAREPIILRSTNTVREYAQTAAGRIHCRAAERVRDITALDAALYADDPGPSARGDGALPADAAASSGRR
ncbi:hypothetical protein ASE95_02745 [Sphingomonas sp. Leaf231]|uniref:hypothetical protein n=1 Tax=Sphingomonas sp. Leaf231 TaxID=1736301 RepID=UPI0007021D94|nr:hypothetical protein [Sphingomonas sp. Leaf231]KQN93841.1 hypothetical protein ASE95_02745 [Sphingomonas sp. Leaf231]